MNRRIMIVEDDFIIRLFISKMISELDCDIVAEAGSSEGAIKAIENFQPEMILMDIGIKGSKDGIETTEFINEHFQIPVIYITGNSDEGTLERARKTNPLGFIFKPIDEESLKRQFLDLCKIFDTRQIH